MARQLVIALCVLFTACSPLTGGQQQTVRPYTPDPHLDLRQFEKSRDARRDAALSAQAQTQIAPTPVNPIVDEPVPQTSPPVPQEQPPQNLVASPLTPASAELAPEPATQPAPAVAAVESAPSIQPSPPAATPAIAALREAMQADRQRCERIVDVDDRAACIGELFRSPEERAENAKEKAKEARKKAKEAKKAKKPKK